MKARLFFSVIFLALSMQIIAQFTVSTDQRQDGMWDEDNQEWTILSTDDDEMTFFEFNEEMTMFKHTTSTITSAYMIKSQSVDDTGNIYEFDVISDVGNKYHMIIDLAEEYIRFVHEKDGTTYLVQHRIKSSWTEE